MKKQVVSKKILHVINSIQGGGAEKMLVDWVNSDLSSYSHHVLSFLPLTSTVKFKNEVSSFDSYSPYQIRNFFKLIPYFRRYEIIHVHLFPAQFWCALLKCFFRKKVLITTEHNTNNRRRNIRLMFFLDIFMYKKFQKIIAISGGVKSELENYLKDNFSIEIIENGVDLEKIKESEIYTKKKLCYNTKDKIILMVSRFSQQKDHVTLLKAFAKIKLTNVRLLFVGDGELKESAMRLSSNLQIKNKVDFLGYRNDVYSIMKMTDVIVQSSFWEGFGLVVVEAAACGKPVVGSDVQGMRELLHNELRFPVQNVNQLVLMLERLLTDSDYYRRMALFYRSISMRYSLEKMVSKYDKIYFGVLNN